MKTKHAVQLPPKKRTKHLFQKIKMCKKCNRYSVIKDDHCYKCGNKYTNIEQLAKNIFKNRVITESVVILILVCLGILAAPTVTTLYSSMIVGILFCIGYIVLHLFFLKSEYISQLKNVIEGDIFKIKSGIGYDNELASSHAEEDNLALAYDEFREIGDFIINDEMKFKRVLLLNQIMLRKDMELELESLVPSTYNREFVIYALEVLKVNKSLVTKRVFSYFIRFRENVEEDFGHTALVSISSATLRMKLYITEYKDFLTEFVEDLPKDRLLRLCSILHANPSENWGFLFEKTKITVKRKYDFDPEFKSYF